MLELTRPWGARVRPYTAPVLDTHVATAEWELRAYHRLRAEVFASEQGLFEGDDTDAHDLHAYPIVAVEHAWGVPQDVVGVVRIYPSQAAGDCIAGGHTWFGGRLAVCPNYRRHGTVGGALIRRAVGTARFLGCDEFLATVQRPAVSYFCRQGFSPLRPVEVCGRPHALMRARLAEFQPLPLPNTLAAGAMHAAQECAA